MNKKANGRMELEDFVGAGFERLDADKIKVNPPRIQWGKLYAGRPIEWRLNYAEKLAAAMNDAAATIQDERDELNKLCKLKEKQIVNMRDALTQNNELIQTQITQMNADRQDYNKAIAALKAEVRELKGGSNS